MSPPLTIVPTPRATVDQRDANSFDFVRFCAASAVLFSHHFALSGLDEPRVPGFGEDFGEVAVEVFFCLSGFLICRSLQKSPGWRRYVAARFLRIFPTLALVLIVSSAATLLWFNNGAHVGAHVRYVIDNLLLMLNGVTFVIPGVFEGAADHELNNPLWTMPYELWLYVMLALLFVFGVRASPFLIVLVALALSTAWAVETFVDDFDLGPLESSELFRLGSYFMSGAVLAVVWPWIGRYAIAIGLFGLLLSLAARNLLPVNTLLHSLALAACVIGFGSSSVMAWFAKGGDASYGIYVFAWPVQQFVLLLAAPFWLTLAIAFLVTSALGYATWHAFERRLMSLPHLLARPVA